MVFERVALTVYGVKRDDLEPGVALLVVEPVIVGTIVDSKHLLVTPVVLELRVGKLRVALALDAE